MEINQVKIEDGKKYTFEKVERLLNRGAVFKNKPTIKEEVQVRWIAGNRSAYMLNRILRTEDVSRNEKIRIYETIIKSVVTYASGLLILTTRKNIHLRYGKGRF